MSYSTTNRYETLYILRGGIPDENTTAIQQKVESVIQKFKGQIELQEDWGLMPMAYAVEKQNTGRYCLVLYKGDSGVVQEVERHFRISGDVLRFLTVQVSADYDYQKAKKQIQAEEEMRKNREIKKKPSYAY